MDIADFKKSLLKNMKAKELAAINFRKSYLVAKNAIELANGEVLASVEIINLSYNCIKIIYNKSTVDLKYTQLSPISRELIKSNFGFTTLDNVIYKNVQVIETDVSTVKFYNENGEIAIILFRRLPKDIQAILGYSADKEAEHEHQQAELKQRQKKQAEIEATKQAENKRKQIEQERQESWNQYIGLCGNGSQELNMARAKDYFNKLYQNKSIEWSGTISSIDNDGFDSMEAYCNLVVRVKMSPSDSFIADLMLYIPKEFKAQLLELNKGDSITFSGKIFSMGGRISDHIIKVYSFNAYRQNN